MLINKYFSINVLCREEDFIVQITFHSYFLLVHFIYFWNFVINLILLLHLYLRKLMCKRELNKIHIPSERLWTEVNKK